MIASATVDLPQPDSPTRPSASRGLMAKLSPGMTLASPARRKNEMRAFSNARIGVSLSVTQPDLPEPDRQEVEADDQRRDDGARNERHVRPDGHHAVGVLDHAAPIRVGRRQADAEEAEHADGDDRVPHPQAHLDDQWPTGVRQDL